MNLRDLRHKRGQSVAAARSILEAAETEKRSMTADEARQFDEHMSEADRLKTDIERAERLETEERSLAAPQPTHAAQREAPGAAETATQADPAVVRSGMQRFIRSGLASMTEPERRALQADVDTAGGYVRPDQQFVADLIQAVDDLVFIRALATVRQVSSADSLGVPVLDNDPDDADWTSELGTGNEDSTMSFGKRELRPHPLAKRIKVSNKLLRSPAINVEELVRERLAYKFAVPQEKAFMMGDGANKPLGLFTASGDGISTARDVSTDNTTTEIKADGLINAKYSLKAQYWNRAGTRWIFHRDGIKQIRKLKDAQNQYLWVPGLQAGQGDRILDIPFIASEYAPNTFTTGKYVGILGDFSFYHIVEALTYQLQRLVELYAEKNQTGFIGRAEIDGMPALEEAFVRVKLA